VAVVLEGRPPIGIVDKDRPADNDGTKQCEQAEGDAGDGQAEAFAAGPFTLRLSPVAAAGEWGAEIGHWSVRMAGELPSGRQGQGSDKNRTGRRIGRPAGGLCAPQSVRKR